MRFDAGRLFWIVIIAASLRVAYAGLLLGVAWRLRAGVSPPDAMPADFIASMLAVGSAGMALWTLYVGAYLLAVILAWLRRRSAVFVYAFAYLLDLGAWIWLATVPGYAITESSRFIDLGFNLLDAALLLGLFFLMRRGELR